MKNLLLFLFITLPILSTNAQKKTKESRPNIIFILTDDQPYDYLSVTGNKVVKTPHIDQLANQGTLFTNAHITSPICMPSRVSMFMSQYERKHGVNFNSGTALSEEAWKNAYPVVMKEAGYFTAYIGKNHTPLGKNGYDSKVMEHAFDYFYAGHRHLGFYPKDRHKIFRGAENDTQIEILEEASFDVLDNNEFRIKEAIKVMEGRPQDQPFLLNICFNLPHGASTSTMKQKETDDEIYRTLFRDQTLPLPENYIAKKDIKTPKLPADLLHAEDRQTIYSHVDTPEGTRERLTRQYQAMVGIDRLVGNLTEKLKELKLDKNTIIVFSSDHGLLMGQYGLGGKALLYEYCTKVSTIIYDPRLPKKKRVHRNDNLVQSIDIAPTMLAKAGIEIPTVYQGKDVSALLTDENASVRPYVYTENLWSTHFGNPRCEAVQNQEWKYIRYYKNDNFSANKRIEYAKALGLNVNSVLYGMNDKEIPVYRSYAESPLNGEEPVYEELYHLADDPNELQNLAKDGQYQQKLEELRKVWAKEIKEARGEGQPLVERFTKESAFEFKQKHKPIVHD
ncbi:sulfatase-like hydrolase/transferase [Flammeovirga sp. SJP92]|uniref:sulfatase-like hydrolase/transferase n=1 Tax=Flammeovirga sp. SJP92 TaxID=1775430 RepID=UPI0007886565|nr:sulfatase-like hydrolase/transferase [Flammeovirga sp. SJP92]KXX69428.1 acetylglucosamine-6-sulfatase [Flammeovirga sp. SJP92]